MQNTKKQKDATTISNATHSNGSPPNLPKGEEHYSYLIKKSTSKSTPASIRRIERQDAE
ncbi:hypothetical protein [Hyunsoonleella pacifica]|uniref:hypothetical protein n=1 Tax=Hyunsoonleella pacifica TaxID=1080224 RepID=UPI0013EF0A9F|nr:hypothetical protein [Hyunsoonleella pacifica]GGD09608.1 hypothetical protein GCM10011368_09460 [Hyunsoonleella pacifica]